MDSRKRHKAGVKTNSRASSTTRQGGKRTAPRSKSTISTRLAEPAPESSGRQQSLPDFDSPERVGQRRREVSPDLEHHRLLPSRWSSAGSSNRGNRRKEIVPHIGTSSGDPHTKGRKRSTGRKRDSSSEGGKCKASASEKGRDSDADERDEKDTDEDEDEGCRCPEGRLQGGRCKGKAKKTVSSSSSSEGRRRSKSPRKRDRLGRFREDGWREEEEVERRGVPSRDGEEDSRQHGRRLGRNSPAKEDRLKVRSAPQKPQMDEMAPPNYYVTEDIISPISLLRSDRFVKNLVSPTLGHGQTGSAEVERTTRCSEAANYGEGGSGSAAKSRIAKKRTGNAPPKVRPESRDIGKSKDSTNLGPPRYTTTAAAAFSEERATQETIPFETCSHDYKLEDDVQFPTTVSGDDDTTRGKNIDDSTEQMRQSPLASGSTEGEFRQHISQSPLRSASIATVGASTNEQFHPSPMRSRRHSDSNSRGTYLDGNSSSPSSSEDHKASDEEDLRAQISQSPLRSTSAPSTSVVDEQFRPSPIRFRPKPTEERMAIRSFESEPIKRSKSSNFSEQLNEHIRAFHVQQELSPPESRISTSPILSRPGSDSRGTSAQWDRKEPLPDPSMVTVEFEESSLVSINRLSQAMEHMALSMDRSGGLLCGPSNDLESKKTEIQGSASSRSASPTVFIRPLLRFDSRS